MKKIIICLFAIFSFTMTSFVFAATAPTSGYYISNNSINGLSAAAQKALPATNITVLNYSEEAISIVYPVNYLIPSGQSRTVAHDSFYGATRITLVDWRNNTFFNQDVCNRAIITVSGRPGYYNYSINPQLCV